MRLPLLRSLQLRYRVQHKGRRVFLIGAMAGVTVNLFLGMGAFLPLFYDSRCAAVITVNAGLAFLGNLRGRTNLSDCRQRCEENA